VINLNKKIFMLDKFLTDLKSPKNRYPIARDLHNPQLGYYYFVFEEQRVAAGKDQKLINRFDENGIPVNKTYIDVVDKEYVYFPISIGQLGLAVFHTYLNSKKPEDKERFLKFVEWFYDHVTVDPKLGARWLTEVALPQYKNPGPWQSAFTQSRAISILLRGYQLTDDKKYCDLAEKALIPFTLPVAEGGVASYTEYGPFYEEYTADVPTLVLNGKIFSIFGIMDFIRVFPENTLARQIYEDGVSTLIKILPEFDLGFWSRYNLCNAKWYPTIDPSTVGYHRLHISQLDVIYHFSNNDFFREVANAFRKQDTLPNILKMYKLKYKSLKMLNRI
jgi:hypothetical protein